MDEGVEIVCELVEEVCEIAFSIVYSHYLEEQAFPHSVDDAKHSLLKIIEVKYLQHVVHVTNGHCISSMVYLLSYIWFCMP